MSNTSHTTDPALPFEKNRYFAAKLMTARDMLAEQAYHSGRLETLTRHIAGTGVISGITIEELSQAGETLTADVPEGLAIDASGDPIVVPESTEVDIHNATDDQVASAASMSRLALYLRYDECSVERVPLPGSENACKQECTYNRVVETYKLVCTPLAADGADDLATLQTELGIADVTFPDIGNLEAITDPQAEETVAGLRELLQIAQQYTPQDRTEATLATQHDVFLGIFGQGPETTSGPRTWSLEYADIHGTRSADDAPDIDGAFVATNDMLYSAITHHTAKFDNPHGTTLSLSASDTQDPRLEIVDSTWDGGSVDFLSSTPALTIDQTTANRTESGELTFDLDWETLIDGKDIVKSITDETSTKTTGDLVFNSQSLDIQVDSTDQQTIHFERGSLVESIDGVTTVGDGDVEIVSTTDTIDSNGVDSNSKLDLKLSDAVEAERDALATYVRDKTLKYTIEAFYDVVHQYGSFEHASGIIKSSRQILERARTALDDREFTTEVDFGNAIRDIWHEEQNILDELQSSIDGSSMDLATTESFDDYTAAVRALQDILEDENNDMPNPYTAAFFQTVSATEFAILQDQVAETATWLELDAEEELPLRRADPTHARIIKDIVGHTPAPVKTRKFDLGELVEDRDDTSAELGVVIENAKEMAAEWIVDKGQGGTDSVADDNPTYSKQDLVVLVAWADALDEEYEHWRAADNKDLFRGVMTRGIKFYAFPESRLTYAEI